MTSRRWQTGRFLSQNRDQHSAEVNFCVVVIFIYLYCVNLHWQIMPNICALFGCDSNSNRNSDLMFHSFPKNQELRNKWIHLCKRIDKINPDISRICSLHFEQTSYARNLRYELLGIPLPRKLVRLKEDAIPTLHLPMAKGEIKIWFSIQGVSADLKESVSYIATQLNQNVKLSWDIMIYNQVSWN